MKAAYPLPKRFFKEHPLKDVSSAKFADFSIRTMFSDDFNDEINQFIVPRISQDRQIDSRRQQEQIANLQTAEEIVSYMRKDIESFLAPMLCKKALAMQQETVPLILRRFQTSYQACFIESATRVLSHADPEFADQLYDLYPSIRNPYAKAMACLIFGEQKMKSAVPLLVQEYERFKQAFPDESFDQAPLLGLYIIHEMV